MMAIAAPGLVLLSLFFGFVGLFVGAAFFVPPAALGLVIAVALIDGEALRVRWIRQLQDHGVVVQARTERRELVSVRIMGMTPVRVVCTALIPRAVQRNDLSQRLVCPSRGGHRGTTLQRDGAGRSIQAGALPCGSSVLRRPHRPAELALPNRDGRHYDRRHDLRRVRNAGRR